MSDFSDAFAAGQSRSNVQVVDDHPFAIVAQHGGGEDVQSLEHLLVRPLRKKGTVRIQDERSFVLYVNAHKVPGSSIFADPDARLVVGVLDHHTPEIEGAPGLPGWGEHRAILQLDKTPEWKAWLQVNRKAMKQGEFAEFLEDNVGDVLSPDGADLMEVVTQLKGLKKVEFTGGVNLSNGEFDLSYSEEVTSTTSRKGKVTVPERLTLKLPLFRNDFPREVRARFRWRLNEGQISFVVVLDKPEKAEDDAMAEIMTRIKGSVAIEVLTGKAP